MTRIYMRVLCCDYLVHLASDIEEMLNRVRPELFLTTEGFVAVSERAIAYRADLPGMHGFNIAL